MSFARRGFRYFLAALLLFSQQQAGLHLLGHGLAQLSAAGVGSDSQHESNESQDLVCAKCLAVAHLDHAVSGTVPTFEPAASPPAPVPPCVLPHRDLAFFASYRSRAPPVLA